MIGTLLLMLVVFDLGILAGIFLKSSGEKFRRDKEREDREAARIAAGNVFSLQSGRLTGAPLARGTKPPAHE